MTFFVSHSRITFSDERQNGTNAFRGALGARLHNSESLYRQWFDPCWHEGPSGYRSAPRPFVLRQTCDSCAGLDLVVFRKDVEQRELEETLRQAVASVPGASDIAVRSATQLELPLEAPQKEGTLRIEFVTPTALKRAGTIANEPEFTTVIRRLAERIRALGRLYQNWPAHVVFDEMLTWAACVKLVNHEWNRHNGESRRSARSDAVHDLRGFTGWAEYEGPVGHFLALLEIGGWTGVGRHTVWGNGMIRVARFTERSAA